jgi:hypothetical protein
VTGVRKGEVAIILTDGQAATLEAMLIEIAKRRLFPGIQNRSIVSILVRIEMATASSKLDRDKP